MQYSPARFPVKRAVVLQSGGVTAVINASLAGVMTQSQRSQVQLWGAHFGILGILKNDFTPLSHFSKTQLDQLKNTPSAALGSCRHKLTENEAHLALKNLQKRNINYLIPIGGNDSAETGLCLARLAKRENYALGVVAVPKTIDNDLAGMDHTPGYGSVARFFAETTQETALDTWAMRYSDPIKIIETMGRNSGWIVASSALKRKSSKDAPHLLYFPERPFDEKQFLKDVERVYKKLGWCVVVVSETIRNKRGERIGREKEHVKADAFGHRYVEGTAQYLAGLVECHLKVRARFEKPGSLQRMSMGYISRVDQKEAFECGRAAVKFAFSGKSEVMVAIQRISSVPYRVIYSAVKLSSIIHQEKLLPHRFIAPCGHDVTVTFKRWGHAFITV